MGYNTCHQLHSSLDASVCARDCAWMEGEPFALHCTVLHCTTLHCTAGEPFAADCRAKGGFFKCCIRRDAAFCHECRLMLTVLRRAAEQWHLSGDQMNTCQLAPILVFGVLCGAHTDILRISLF
jgi:hypothetical protein